MKSVVNGAQNRSPGLGLKLLIYMGVPISGAGIDIFIPSLPSMAQSLTVPDSAVALTIPVYLAAYGLAQPIFGTWSDTVGRRVPLLSGVLLFVLGSLIAATSTSLSWLLFGRILQGIGVSGPAVLTKTVLTDAFSGKERMKMANTMTIAWAVGPVLSPALGGYLETLFGWRAAFFFLVLYSALFFVLSYFYWPETCPDKKAFRLKEVTASFREILSHGPFLVIVILLSTIYSFMTVFNVIGPFLMQSTLHYTSIEFGKMALWLGAAWFLGNVLSKAMAQKVSRMVIVWTGLTANLIFTLVMVALAYTQALTVWSVLGPTFALFLVGGAVFPNLWGRALSIFPNSAGTASAIMGTILILGAGLASAAASLLSASTAHGLSLAYLVLVVLALGLLKLLTVLDSIDSSA